MTVLYTTHYMEEAEELSHRVGIIDHGEMIALGTQAELTRQVGENDMLALRLPDGEDEATADALAAAARSLPRRAAGERRRSHCDHPRAQPPKKSWPRPSRRPTRSTSRFAR